MKKVLVADDTKNIRILLSKCLELEGYEVQTANDGQQAIELFKNTRFDLAFLDIKMPEIRGTEVLKKIREMGIETPVI
ncbi:MAG: response regulator, partial [Ruminiclostridium sp.]|nr:response regulator [Ruminiclostridium sp.]